MKEMNKDQVIKQVEEFAERSISQHDGGHDWWHEFMIVQDADRLETG